MKYLIKTYVFGLIYSIQKIVILSISWPLNKTNFAMGHSIKPKFQAITGSRSEEWMLFVGFLKWFLRKKMWPLLKGLLNRQHCTMGSKYNMSHKHFLFWKTLILMPSELKRPVWEPFYYWNIFFILLKASSL